MYVCVCVCVCLYACVYELIYLFIEKNVCEQANIYIYIYIWKFTEKKGNIYCFSILYIFALFLSPFHSSLSPSPSLSFSLPLFLRLFSSHWVFLPLANLKEWLCRHIYIYIYIYVFVYVCVRMFVSVCACVYVSAFVYHENTPETEGGRKSRLIRKNFFVHLIEIWMNGCVYDCLSDNRYVHNYVSI